MLTNAQVALAEEWAAGEYSQLEHAEVEGSVAQLYDYEELPANNNAGGCVGRGFWYSCDLG